MQNAADIAGIVEIATVVVLFLVLIWVGYMYWVKAVALKAREIDDKEKAIDQAVESEPLEQLVDDDNREMSGHKQPGQSGQNQS